MHVFSSPGKVILHGEHSVVFGKTAVACAVDLRTFAIIRSINQSENIVLRAPGIEQSWTISDIHEIVKQFDGVHDGTMFENKIFMVELCNVIKSNETRTHASSLVFLYLYCSLSLLTQKTPPVDVTIHTQSVIGAGLGSSASYCVCLSAALLRLFDLIPDAKRHDANIGAWSKEDRDVINKWAYGGERIIHGRSSGIDNSVITHGGAVKFRQGDITMLKSTPQLEILITNTNVPRSTKTLVANVANKLQQYPRIITPILESMDSLAETSLAVLERLADTHSSEDIIQEENLIDMNQHLLCCLGVSHSSLDHIVMTTHKYGLHSKLTGAGGGGCVFTLINQDISADHVTSLLKELESQGYHSWLTKLGAQGVCQHFVSNEAELHKLIGSKVS